MKIQKLAVEGFRSLADVAWTPGDLNLVIGPNASGKTNLLRILELVSVAARGGLGKYVLAQGGIEPLLWDGAAKKFTINLSLTPEGHFEAKLTRFDYATEFSRLGTSSSYRCSLEVLAKHNFTENSTSNLIKRTPSELVIASHGATIEHLDPAQFSEEETALAMMGWGFFFGSDVLRIHRELTSWGVYKGFDTVETATIRKPAVTRMDRRVSPDGQNLTSVLHTLYTGDRDFKREINLAMRAAFGDEFEELIFPPAADQLVQLRIRWKSLKREQSAADLSDGTLRFLFLLAVLASPDPPPLIAIDEPEVGLHPSMLPIVAEYAAQAAKETQVILTTHSPALLDAFTNLNPTITIAHWVEGKTELQVKSGDELAHWLKEYSLGEIYRTGELEAVE